MPASLANLGRRRLLIAAAGTSLVGAPLVSHAATGLSKVTLRIGTYKGNWRALLVAAKLTDTPYHIDWRELNNGVLHIEAINGDALDLGSGSEIPAVFAARQKANVRFIAVIREDLNNQVTLARKDAGIRSIADLKGKRVGYVRATTAHYFLQKQLAEAGLSFPDIQAINLTPADGLSAFDRGDLDAWAIFGYNGQLARTR
ncbi:MAG: ABC transporter substrate-binding protein, partial [Rhizobacter sp.]